MNVSHVKTTSTFPSLTIPFLGNRFSFDDEDDDSLDLIRLSVLHTNSSFDADSKLDESGETNDEPNDGERFCFSGWIKLVVSTKKQKKCWLTLRGDELAFYEDDTVGFLSRVLDWAFLVEIFVLFGK